MQYTNHLHPLKQTTVISRGSKGKLFNSANFIQTLFPTLNQLNAGFLVCFEVFLINQPIHTEGLKGDRFIFPIHELHNPIDHPLVSCSILSFLDLLQIIHQLMHLRGWVFLTGLVCIAQCAGTPRFSFGQIFQKSLE